MVSDKGALNETFWKGLYLGRVVLQGRRERPGRAVLAVEEPASERERWREGGRDIYIYIYIYIHTYTHIYTYLSPSLMRGLKELESPDGLAEHGGKAHGPAGRVEDLGI